MKINGYNIILISISCATSLYGGNLYAQTGANSAQTTTIETKEVTVTRSYQRSINDANRINMPLSVSDSLANFTTTFSYKVNPVFMPSFALNSKIEPAEIQETAQAPSKNVGYLRLGLGYPLSPLADLYLHSLNIKNSIANIYYNHRSYWANTTLTTDQPYPYELPQTITGNNAQHDLGVSIQHRVKNMLIHADFEYKHRYLIFHGHDTAYLDYLHTNHPDYIARIAGNAGGVKEILQQTYNIFNAQLGIASQSARDGFAYTLDFTFGHARDKAVTAQGSGMPVREYAGGLQGKFTQTFEHTHSGSLAYKAVVYNKGNASHLTDGLFMVTPAYEYQKDGIGISVGVNLEGVYESADTPARDSGKLTLHIYPNIIFTGRLSDYFTAYAKITGQTDVHTYQQTVLENPYVLPGLTVANSRTPFHAEAGGKGRIFDVFGYNLFGAYSLIDSLYYYVNSAAPVYMPNADPAAGYLHNNFDVLYHKTNQITIGADVNYTLNRFEAIARMRYYLYLFHKTATAKAWHKPSWEVHCDLRYQYDEWTFAAGVYARGAAPVPYQNPQTGATDATIKPYLDVSLQAEYRVNKRLTAFVQFNNLLNRRYQNYYLYYHHGITAAAGITLSF